MNNNFSSNHLNEIINFGLQPRCFDFITNVDKNVELFEFALCQSKKTGLIQLKKALPADLLKPKFSWVKNREPDDHAHIIADELLRLTKHNNSNVLFLSHFDKKAYDLVKEHIGSRAIMLDSKKDLGISKKNPTQALIQQKINTNKNLSDMGSFDIIVSCRLLEHSSDIKLFIDRLSKLLNKDGKIIFEIPDSSKSLLQGDIAMLWEEHTYYFTPESLRLEMESYGYILDKYIIYNYPQEDALIGIFNRISNHTKIKTHTSLPFGEYAISSIFKNKIEFLKEELNKQLSILKKKYGEVIIFGAGHRAIMFINLLHISENILFIVDDDPHKNKLRIPLSNIEILSSNDLTNRDIGICIFAISLGAELKVQKILDEKCAKKLKFYSISPDSPLALPIFNFK